MNFLDLEWLQGGGFANWRAGFVARNREGNPPWGPWNPYLPGEPSLLHGREETERAVMWLLPPRFPAEADAECAYWTLRRQLAYPGPEEGPRLLPWEALALHEYLCDVGHRGALIIEGMPHPPPRRIRRPWGLV